MSLPGCRWAGQDFAVFGEREGSLLASFGADRGEGSEAVSRPWPSYGRARCRSMPMWRLAGEVEVPRPVCPSCAGPLVFWSGYWRHVRAAGRCRKIFVPQVAVRPVPGEPCAAAGVRAGLAAGCGRDGRRGDRGRWRAAGAGSGRRPRGPGSRIPRRGAGCGGSGRARRRARDRRSRRWRWSWAGRRSARPAEAGRFALAAIRRGVRRGRGLAGMAGGWACGGSRRR